MVLSADFEGRQLFFSTPLGGARPSPSPGVWASPACKSLLASLFDELRDRPAPTDFSVEDVLVASGAAGGEPRAAPLRQVFSSPSLAWPNTRNGWVDGGNGTSCEAALFTHAFPAPGGGRLLLRTLLCGARALREVVLFSFHEHILPAEKDEAQELAPRVLGDAQLASSDQRSALAVWLVQPGAALPSLNDAPSISPAELSAWPLPLRTLLKAAREAQLLHALRACATQQWAGGVALLHGRCAALLPPAACAAGLEPLALALLSGGGAPAPSLEVCQARERQAVAAEAAGDYEGAAALYLQNIRARVVASCVPAFNERLLMRGARFMPLT